MRTVLMILPFLALAACGTANSESREAGPSGSRNFAVGAFNAVSLEGSDNVRIVPGGNVSVSATGSQRVLDALDIRVDGNTLKIDRKRSSGGWSWRNDRGAMVTVTMPTLSAVAVGGSGDMTVDRAEGDAFSAAASGSGDLELKLVTVKRAQLSASGSGNIKATGTAIDATMGANGSGNIEARALSSQRVTIAAEGSGDVSATATESATLNAGGSGNIDVTGTDRCMITKDGSGEARCTR